MGSDLRQRPDKVGHVINVWKLRLNGQDGLSVARFIYRVEALTHQTVEGNFSVLCSNASIFFDGKAREFYWRYHKSSRKTGVGGVLVQKSKNGDEYPIAFMSKKLNKAQKNHSVTKQECLAAIICVKRFRAYVEGHEFTIITDHASLKWLMSQTDLHSRLARWALKLQAFNFKIEH